MISRRGISTATISLARQRVLLLPQYSQSAGILLRLKPGTLV
jgi:hypothetical protein